MQDTARTLNEPVGRRSGALSGAADLLQLVRPKQWVKNLIVFVPAVFGGVLFNPQVFINELCLLVSFCLASSAIYILNDIMDRENDRRHPKKCRRPIASRRVSVVNAAVLCATLIAFALSSVLLLPAAIRLGALGVLLTYLVTLGSYCLCLRNIAVADILLVASGFVFRAIGGAVVASVVPSSWFLLCTTFGALFVSIKKRLQEAKLLGQNGSEHRQTLSLYTPHALERMETASLACLIISYGLYALQSQHGQAMVLTLPFVLFGVFRYLLVADTTSTVPEEMFLHDKPLFWSVLLWVIASICIIYMH